MTDELEDKDLNEDGEVGEGEEVIAGAHADLDAEPDFTSATVAPAAFDDHHDDDEIDPHAEPFHRTDAEEASFTDPYGVGVPMGHGDGDDYEDDEEEEGYLMNDSDSY